MSKILFYQFYFSNKKNKKIKDRKIKISRKVYLIKSAKLKSRKKGNKFYKIRQHDIYRPN